METVERFSQNQRVIEDYTLQSLAGIHSDVGRLFHVSMLRNVSSGCYRHPALEQFYSESAIHDALFYCHEELFDKFLQHTLEEQEWELRRHFATLDHDSAEIAGRWLELEYFRLLVPLGTPSYLRDLFVSNLQLTLKLIATESSGALAAS
jgi:hypothetical protein